MKRRTLNLSECCDCSGAEHDATDSVLRNVKIIGAESENGRRYTEAAMESGLQAYGDSLVNIDHPDRPTNTRSLRDRFGRLENVRRESGCVRGDLRYNPHHAMAETVRWYAENMPEALGLSHNAVGQGHTEEDGTFVVERIVSVRSVDLVADPATTRSLFEQRGAMMTTLRQFLESISSRLDLAKRDRLKKLLEDGYGEDTAMEAPPADDATVEPDDALAAGFESAAMAIIKKCLDGEMDCKAAVAKLKDLLQSHERLSDGGAGDGEDEDGEDEEDDLEDDEDGDMAGKKHKRAGKGGRDVTEEVSSLRKEVDTLKVEKRSRERRDRAMVLCREARLPDFSVTPVFMESLVAAKDDREVRKLIEDRKAVATTRTPKSAPAGTGPGGSGMELKEFVRKVKKGA